MPFDTDVLKAFSTKPGVYLMKDKAGKVIYVGKAKNLRQRVRQYFVKGGDGRFMIPFLVSKVESIETVVVSSEKEALLLENNLIKKHKPRYNALLKDDKSYIALKLTRHHWPRIDLVRYKGKPKADGIYFGPYAHAGAARKTLDLLHKIFPLRQCSDQEFARRNRPCILYDIKKCVAPCVGYCSKEEYDELAAKAVRFLRGNDKEVIRDLYRKMERCSSEMQYEQAAEIYRTIQSIEKTVEGQHVDKPLGVDADALGLHREGEEVLLALLMFKSGRLTGSKCFSFRSIAQDDQELVQSFIFQHYADLPSLPHEVIAPLDIEEGAIIAEHLSEGRSRKLSIISPKRGEKRKLVEMAAMNAESEFRKEKDADAIIERTLLQMRDKFHLSRYPKRIECFDISTISGEETVATKVAFLDGKKDASAYRKYKIKTLDRPDDYGAMYEALIRRFRKAEKENHLPDLLMIDGGKGHLNVALRVLQELNIISVDVIGLAKEDSRHDKGQTLDQVFLPNVKDPLLLSRHSQILFFLQKIRDEAHRTAIAFHRKRRSKALIKSALDDVPGIGNARKKALLKHFGSLKKIKEASIEELVSIPGISEQLAELIRRL
ncbi:UvrABC system protein C [Waddlia chondrophila 2032/99]|nr:excinuclease ABC subunit UvrC [Waddlia chondrophila]CCB91353.1 UvrABC system protein C [Waddlia chondrophila 2032/99]